MFYVQKSSKMFTPLDICFYFHSVVQWDYPTGWIVLRSLPTVHFWLPTVDCLLFYVHCLLLKFIVHRCFANHSTWQKSLRFLVWSCKNSKPATINPKLKTWNFLFNFIIIPFPKQVRDKFPINRNISVSFLVMNVS